MAMRFIGPFQILWGEPRHDTRLRACTGHIRKGDGPWTAVFTAHTVQRWYAFAFKRRWMVGIVHFGATEDGYDAGAPTPPSAQGGGDAT